MNIVRRKTLFKDLRYHSILQFMMNHFYLSVQYLFQVYLDFAAIHGPFLAPTKRIISEIRAACPTFIDANLIIVTDVGFFFLGAELQPENRKKLVHIAVSAPPLPGPASRHM